MEPSKDDEDKKSSVMKILNDFKSKTNKIITLDQMKKALTEQGFTIKYNVVQNITENSGTIQGKL